MCGSCDAYFLVGTNNPSHPKRPMHGRAGRTCGTGGWDGGTRYNSCVAEVTASAGGEPVAKFRMVSAGGVSYYNPVQPTVITHAFSNGLPIDEGDSLTLTHSGGCDVSYTLSGYYAQP